MLINLIFIIFVEPFNAKIDYKGIGVVTITSIEFKYLRINKKFTTHFLLFSFTLWAFASQQIKTNWNEAIKYCTLRPYLSSSSVKNNLLLIINFKNFTTVGLKKDIKLWRLYGFAFLENVVLNVEREKKD